LSLKKGEPNLLSLGKKKKNFSSFCIAPAFIPLRSVLPVPPPEADDLAQYLDHLLAQSAPKKPKRQLGALGRFKAAATKTKDMVSLMNKAQELNVQSE